MNIDPCYQRQKCKANDSSFWRYKIYADIFAEVPWEGASNDSGVIDNGNFQRFARYFS